MARPPKRRARSCGERTSIGVWGRSPRHVSAMSAPRVRLAVRNDNKAIGIVLLASGLLHSDTLGLE